MGPEPELQDGGRIRIGVIYLREADEQAGHRVAVAGEAQREGIGTMLQRAGERVRDRVLRQQEKANGKQDQR